VISVEIRVRCSCNAALDGGGGGGGEGGGEDGGARRLVYAAALHIEGGMAHTRRLATTTNGTTNGTTTNNSKATTTTNAATKAAASLSTCIPPSFDCARDATLASLVHSAVGRVLLATLSTRAHALGLHTELVAAAGQITISREPRKSPSASPLALPPSPWLRVRVRPWHEACGAEDHLHVTSSASGEPVRLREGGGELAELTRLLFNVMAP
jgi:hypothetical protein